MKTFFAKLDLRDACLYGGILLLGLGASLVYAPAGLIVVGACLFYVAVWGIAASNLPPEKGSE